MSIPRRWRTVLGRPYSARICWNFRAASRPGFLAELYPDHADFALQLNHICGPLEREADSACRQRRGLPEEGVVGRFATGGYAPATSNYRENLAGAGARGLRRAR